MMWDFAENNVFGMAAGDYAISLGNMIKALEKLPATADGHAAQDDAQSQTVSSNKVISTDPPYYDNIGYADLSDFFYVWLRRALKDVHPQIFSTLAVPKTEELVATPYRHGGRKEAEQFFMSGMTEPCTTWLRKPIRHFPSPSTMRSSRQSERVMVTRQYGLGNFPGSCAQSRICINGTWPMRTELSNRMIGSGANALASSIVLVCRPREATAESISRKDFQRQLRGELPEALETMIGGREGEISPIAPVDLAQAAIGPGMAVYSRYSVPYWKPTARQ